MTCEVQAFEKDGKLDWGRRALPIMEAFAAIIWPFLNWVVLYAGDEFAEAARLLNIKTHYTVFGLWEALSALEETGIYSLIGILPQNYNTGYGAAKILVVVLCAGVIANCVLQALFLASYFKNTGEARSLCRCAGVVCSGVAVFFVWAVFLVNAKYGTVVLPTAWPFLALFTGMAEWKSANNF